MRVLTIRQPWAYAILHLGKDIENRTWPTHYRGRIAVHAGLRVDHDQVVRLRAAGYDVPDGLPTGAVVGTVEVVDCVPVAPGERPWAVGPWGFLLRDPRPMRPRAMRGRLGLWRIEGWQ